MRYYLIAGEASGDLHGSNLMKALKEKDKKAEFRFWGGDLMKNCGGELVKHCKDLAFMGFLEVLLNIRTILKNIKSCKKDILAYQPHALILIDYPGFNLRIAAFAKENKIPVHYYISPQLWAWKENRIHKVKRDVDQMYVILPFEKAFYETKHQFPVHFVGHPLLDAIHTREKMEEHTFRKEYKLSDKPIIALLPGSRKQEIKKMLQIMTSVIPDFKDYEFVIAGAPSQSIAFYRAIIGNDSLKIIPNKTYDLLTVATAALVTSGTATLETALFNVPEIVCYKTSSISYLIAKKIINLKYISLVNLIMNREVVRELIQGQLNKSNLNKELELLLDPKQKELFKKDYAQLKTKLGGVGASENTAELIYNFTNTSSKRRLNNLT